MLNVNFHTENGVQTIEAETVAAISQELATAGYDGGSLKVYDEAGFVRGFASATDWQAV
jgi:hypothetical protein